MMACAAPAEPGGRAQLVLAEANGRPLPAVLDTIAGVHGLERQLASAELKLLGSGRLRWRREYLLSNLDPAAPGTGANEEQLSGWYATDGHEFVMELLTGPIADGRTVTVHGEFRDGALELEIPLHAGVRVERYIHVR